jgi:hypothetical protein
VFDSRLFIAPTASYPIIILSLSTVLILTMPLINELEKQGTLGASVNSLSNKDRQGMGTGIFLW